MSRYNYTYIPGPVGMWLPLLSIQLRGPSGVLPLRPLVDSGSWETLMPEDVLEQIGVVPTDEQHELAGFNDARTVGRVAKVRIEIPSLHASYESRIIATPHDAKVAPLLGHRDFFQNFYVGFDGTSRSFYVAAPRLQSRGKRQ